MLLHEAFNTEQTFRESVLIDNDADVFLALDDEPHLRFRMGCPSEPAAAFSWGVDSVVIQVTHNQRVPTQIGDSQLHFGWQSDGVRGIFAPRFSSSAQ